MIKIKNLSVTYLPFHKPAVKGFSLDLKKSETLAILGPSGCGKTTILKVISGLITKEQAKIEGTLKLDKKTKVRMVFQEPNLLPWQNALENVEFGLLSMGMPKVEARKTASKYLNMVGLRQSKAKYPHQLSHGMRQRVNFARAVACRPGLLLMDEPFSALDQVTKLEIIKLFRDIIRENNITTILVTHDITEASILADKIKKMTKGNNAGQQIINNTTPNKYELLSEDL